MKAIPDRIPAVVVARFGRSHSSTSTTQHYAHLALDFFGAKAFDMVAVDLTRPTGNVVDFARSGGPLRQRIGRKQEFTEEQKVAKSA